MAEHDSDRADREERGGPEDREPERTAEHREGREHPADRGSGGPGDPVVPLDEDAAWAAIVAGYGDEPPDPPGAKPFKSVEDLALLEAETNDDRPEGDRSGAAGTAVGRVLPPLPVLRRPLRFPVLGPAALLAVRAVGVVLSHLWSSLPCRDRAPAPRRNRARAGR
nr:hypothetical protein [Streptomyces rochei]